MNKWIFRLTGILFILLLLLWFFYGWFNPDIPDYMKNGPHIQTGKESTDRHTIDEQVAVPSLSLTSLEDDQSANNDTSSVAEGHVIPAGGEVQHQPKAISDVQELPVDTPQVVLSNPDASPINDVWLQAGSFLERANADKRAVVLKAQGWHVDIEPAKVDGKMYYRVYVGPLVPDQVSAYMKKLDALNINAREVTR